MRPTRGWLLLALVSCRLAQADDIIHAAERGDVAAVQRYLRAGISPNVAQADWQRRRTPLHAAAQAGALEVARVLLRAGADVDALDGGASALHVAVEWRRLPLLALLVEHGATLGPPAPGCDSALHIAVRSADRGPVLAWLLAHGADPNAVGSDGATPLHDAALAGNLEFVEKLLAQGARLDVRDRDGLTPLDWACAQDEGEGLEALVKPLLARGAPGGVRVAVALRDLGRLAVCWERDGDARPLGEDESDGARPSHERPRRQTALSLAVGAEWLEGARWLLDHGADPSAPGWERAPLALAIALDSRPLAELLLARGASTKLDRYRDLTPAKAAEEAQHPALARFLRAWRPPPSPLEPAARGDLDRLRAAVAAGASVNVGDPYGQRPLHLAAAGGHGAVVRWLLSHGALLDARDRDGRTPLLAAAAAGQAVTLGLLLDAGARVHAVDVHGRTALHGAAASGVGVPALLARGAQVAATDSAGRAPLHLASTAAAATSLLDAGAPLGQADRDGWTALHLAAERGRVEVVSLLLARGADPRTRTTAGATPRERALWCGQTATAALLPPG